MSDKEAPKRELVKEDESEVTDLSTIGEITGSLTRPKSLDKDDVSGTEDIGADEIKLPRLTIAQGLSKQLIPSESVYIEALKMFDMFNDMTGTVYGKGPITFIPLKREAKRIEFTPRSEGGGVVDLNVPKGDKRLKWTWSSPELQASGAKADVPPKAVEIEEFVVMLVRPGQQPEPIVFGIARKNKWNRQAADKLVSTIKLRTAPIYANLFSVDTSKPASNDKGTFGVPTIRDLGYIPIDKPAGKALFTLAKEFYESMQGKTIVVNDIDADAEIDDSMAANPEGPSSNM